MKLDTVQTPRRVQKTIHHYNVCELPTAASVFY